MVTLVTQVEHHGVQQLWKRAGKKQLHCQTATAVSNVRLPHNIAVSFPPRLHPTRSLRDRSTHTWTRFTVVKFFLEHVGWRRLGTRQKKGRENASSYTQRMRRFRRCSERRVRKPTKKEKKKLKLHRRSIIRASLTQHMLFHWHVDKVTWKAHSQVTVTRTMEHRRQSNK